MEKTIDIKERFKNYITVLETSLQSGANYEDLLKIKPDKYGLPDMWTGAIAYNQYSSILLALNNVFGIDTPESLLIIPSLRVIAEEIKAPYSVVMDCYKVFYDKPKNKPIKPTLIIQANPYHKSYKEGKEALALFTESSLSKIDKNRNEKNKDRRTAKRNAKPHHKKHERENI